VALVGTTDTLKKPRLSDRTEPSLVALYYIQPGNGAGLFFKARSPHGAHMRLIRSYNFRVFHGKIYNHVKQL